MIYQLAHGSFSHVNIYKHRYDYENSLECTCFFYVLEYKIQIETLRSRFEKWRGRTEKGQRKLEKKEIKKIKMS